MTTLKNNFKKYLPYLLIYIASLICVFSLIAQNKFSLIFDSKQILERFGDQRLYIELANNLLKRKIEPHPYSIGYPLFIAPFVIFLKTTTWQTVSKYLVFVQGFLFFPLTLLILLAIFRKIYLGKESYLKILAIVITTALVLYELSTLYHSADPVPFFLFFGLIPYSEPLAIFAIILAYGIFILKNSELKKYQAVIIGTLLSFSVLTRITYLILALPIIIFYSRYFFEKKESFFFFGALLISYIPQLIYNWIAYGNPLSSGYVWYWQHIKEEYIDVVNNIYHTDTLQMFSIQYLKINISSLIKKYIHYLLAVFFGLFSAILQKRKISKTTFFFLILLNISALSYLVLILSYLWSPHVDCIDRFLLPLTFFLVISVFFSISLYERTKQLQN